MPMGIVMSERRVRLFRNGRNQAVRIPREFELPGKEVTMRLEDGRLILEPLTPVSLLEYLKTMTPIEEDWPDIEDPRPDAVEL
jgi:antitoxin VapB